MKRKRSDTYTNQDAWNLTFSCAVVIHTRWESLCVIYSDRTQKLHCQLWASHEGSQTNKLSFNMSKLIKHLHSHRPEEHNEFALTSEQLLPRQLWTGQPWTGAPCSDNAKPGNIRVYSITYFFTAAEKKRENCPLLTYRVITVDGQLGQLLRVQDWKHEDYNFSW